jgi:hypothetical protein
MNGIAAEVDNTCALLFAVRNNGPNVLPPRLLVSEQRDSEKKDVPVYLWNSRT